MANKFAKQDFINDIYQNAIVKTFPLLNNSHKAILLEYLINTINVIALSFNFDTTKSEIYEHQFRQNNYQDTVALLQLLLPFINENDDNTAKQGITSFNDIFVAKFNPNVDINKEEPKYVYSNLQYQRCIRDPKSGAIEREYKKEYLDHNYLLLLSSIRFVAYKLYVNWYDVLPYAADTDTGTGKYKTSKLYLDTVNRFEKQQLTDWEPSLTDLNLNALIGLSTDDIYDTISNELYHNIAKIKWVIYDIKIDYPPEYKFPVPLLQVVNLLFKLDDTAFKNRYWDNLNDDERNSFKNRWNNFLYLFFNNRNYDSNDIGLNIMMILRVLRGLLFNFDKNYYNKKIAIEKDKYIPTSKNKDVDLIENDDDDDDDDDGVTAGLSYAEVISLQSLPPKHLYEYIRDSVQKLRYTWYYKKLFDQNDNNKKLIVELLDSDVYGDENTKIYLTFKNIYNYAKSLTHYYGENNSYPQIPKFWRSLDSAQRRETLNRLNNIANEGWFSLSGYIGSTYDDATKKEHPETNIGINRVIHKMIRKYLVEIVFQSMIYRGVLSQFIPLRELTEQSQENQTQEQQKELAKKYVFKDWDLYKNSFYYLNGKLYGQMGDDFIQNGIFYYAMNWISQIAFFHKYLNNRVILVTGATGVGKSTQVPKLLMYALKAIDYKHDGRIVCTQPRRAPTEQNARQVAKQLFVPIVSNTNEPTDNYYVQFKYQGANHVARRSNHLTLKFVTDGLLINEITNPLLKEMYDSVTFKMQNLYDIVIVDEAHEHNKNMDLILTLMRYVTYYNNDIKLVIVSATMDDDEPVYRRYYRDVNDNRMYPLNYNISKNNWDRINIDRRLHISAPGQTTRYKIIEKYVPEAATDPIKLILDVVNENPDGNLLYFLPGQAEIDEAVTSLNNSPRFPSNIIALPFYRALNKYQREFIENLATRLDNIHIDRRIPFREFSEETNTGTVEYKRFVLVATNIAEASLTLEDLAFIVDTGTQKTPVYNFITGIETSTKPISESSRLQRKGRVGRTGPGVVYYLYSKGSKENIKRSYDIVISDIHKELYDRLYNTYTEKPIFTPNNDPNRPGINLNVAQLPALFDRNALQGLATIIEKQYFIDNKFYAYVGNYDHYDYNNGSRFVLPNIYPSGFSLETLNDSQGNFYIVHPIEPDLQRNILGQITGVKSEKENLYVRYEHNGRVVSDKILSFWTALLDDLYMSAYTSDDGTAIRTMKTPLGLGISAVEKRLGDMAINSDEFNPQLIDALLYGIALDFKEEIIRLIAMYIATNNDFVANAVATTIVGKGTYRKNYNGLKAVVGSTNKSDSDCILILVNDFHNMLQRNRILLDQNDKSLFQEFEKIKYDIYNNTYDVSDEDDDKIFKDIKKMMSDEEEGLTNSASLSSEEYRKLREKGVIAKKIMQTVKKNNFIKSWTDSHIVKYDVMLTYLERYLVIHNILYLQDTVYDANVDRLVAMITQITKNKESLKDNSDIRLWANYNYLKYDTLLEFIEMYMGTNGEIKYDFKLQLNKLIQGPISGITSLIKQTIKYPINDNDKCILSLMYAFKRNIAKKVINNFYISIYEPAIDNLYNISGPAPHILNTLVENKYLSNYILYISKRDNKIAMIHYVNTNLLKYIGYAYSRDSIYNKYNRYLSMPIKLEVNLLPVNTAVASLYKRVLTEIMNDVINTHDADIWRHIQSVYEDKKYLQIRQNHDDNYLTKSEFHLFSKEYIQTGGRNGINADIDLVKYLFKKFEKIIL